MASTVEQELEMRMRQWRTLIDSYGEPPCEIPPKLLNDMKVYLGGRGIWRDKGRTSQISNEESGIAVGVLHTGVHYDDDLTDTEILYHYPTTEQASHDSGDIQSLKNAMSLRLPIFVISKETTNSKKRNAHLGWVTDWDDDLRLALIQFNDESNGDPAPPETEETSFSKTSDETDQDIQSAKRKRRSRSFKLKVFKRYKVNGSIACALTNLGVPGLLDAAHLYPKSMKGTDDPRNGLPLAPTVHRALDQGHIAISPHDFSVCGDQEVLAALGICNKNLHHLPNLPHPEALEHLWEKFNEERS